MGSKFDGDEGGEKPDPRLWRIDELAQVRGRTRRRMVSGILIGMLLLTLWVAAGWFFGMWGIGLVLGPVGAFMVLWGIIQLVLAAISGESFEDRSLE